MVLARKELDQDVGALVDVGKEAVGAGSVAVSTADEVADGCESGTRHGMKTIPLIMNHNIYPLPPLQSLSQPRIKVKTKQKKKDICTLVSHRPATKEQKKKAAKRKVRRRVDLISNP